MPQIKITKRQPVSIIEQLTDGEAELVEAALKKRKRLDRKKSEFTPTNYDWLLEVAGKWGSGRKEAVSEEHDKYTYVKDVDAKSFALMERLGVLNAFAFDKHFDVFKTKQVRKLTRLPHTRLSKAR